MVGGQSQSKMKNAIPIVFFGAQVEPGAVVFLELRIDLQLNTINSRQAEPLRHGKQLAGMHTRTPVR